MMYKNKQNINIIVPTFTERDSQNEKMSQALQISMSSKKTVKATQLRAWGMSYEKEGMTQFEAKSPEHKAKTRGK